VFGGLRVNLLST